MSKQQVIKILECLKQGQPEQASQAIDEAIKIINDFASVQKEEQKLRKALTSICEIRVLPRSYENEALKILGLK